MYRKAETLDDLMLKVIRHLLKKKQRIKATKGSSFEELGVVLKLVNPRARISLSETKGTIFSCLGELFWYLSGSNDLAFIEHFIPLYNKSSDDGVSIYGGYGPRLFHKQTCESKPDKTLDQIKGVIELIRHKPTTRRAVVQLYDASDLFVTSKDIPCTCTLQFFSREGLLDLHVHMRSNDAFKGLPHDVFCFTMLQEIVARELDFEIGEYTHSVGSLHLYDSDEEKAKAFLEEGFQTVNPMPPMPRSPQLANAKSAAVYARSLVEGTPKGHDGFIRYWKDLCILLQFYSEQKKDTQLSPRLFLDEIEHEGYKSYILKRTNRIKQVEAPQQFTLRGFE